MKELELLIKKNEELNRSLSAFVEKIDGHLKNIKEISKLLKNFDMRLIYIKKVADYIFNTLPKETREFIKQDIDDLWPKQVEELIKRGFIKEEESAATLISLQNEMRDIIPKIND